VASLGGDLVDHLLHTVLVLRGNHVKEKRGAASCDPVDYGPWFLKSVQPELRHQKLFIFLADKGTCQRIGRENQRFPFGDFTVQPQDVDFQSVCGLPREGGNLRGA